MDSFLKNICELFTININNKFTTNKKDVQPPTQEQSERYLHAIEMVHDAHDESPQDNLQYQPPKVTLTPIKVTIKLPEPSIPLKEISPLPNEQ